MGDEEVVLTRTHHGAFQAQALFATVNTNDVTLNNTTVESGATACSKGQVSCRLRGSAITWALTSHRGLVLGLQAVLNDIEWSH